MVWRITPSGLLVDDPDAMTYLAAVEAADGQALESGVRLAVNAFVKGCKIDGIWPAIKASCILAGARTLAGALVPLVGAAPTNFNFVSGDYNRKTGLVGNGSTKYLNSNRDNNADPRDSSHLSLFVATSGILIYASANFGSTGSNVIGTQSSPGETYFRNRSNTSGSKGTNLQTGFVGMSRNSGSSFIARSVGSNSTINVASESPSTAKVLLYSTGSFFSTVRLSFYSIGESVDLALLDSRVTTLINALAAAIP